MIASSGMGKAHFTAVQNMGGTDRTFLAPISIEKYLSAAQFVIERALDPAPANAAIRSKIMLCTPPMTPEADCGKRIVGDFAKRAFRRPVTADEVAPYTGLIDVAKMAGDNFEAGLKVALARPDSGSSSSTQAISGASS